MKTKIILLTLSMLGLGSVANANLVASYSFETILSGPDRTPNDAGISHYDLQLPEFGSFAGAAGAISIGAGRNGGNALSPNLAPSPGYAVPAGTGLDTEFDNASQFTLLGWYRGSNIGATAGRIFDRMSNSNQDGFFLRVNSASLDARLRVGDGATGVNVDTPAGFFVSDDTWQFFAVTFDSGAVTFYSGDEFNLASIFHSGNNGLAATGVSSTGPWELTIGTQSSSPSGALFNGYLDDLQLYNSALSLSEIQAVQIPEPSTYITLFGILAIGIAIWRRNKA